MTNFEAIKSMNEFDLAVLVLGCKCCIYWNAYCGDCDDGKAAWLKRESEFVLGNEPESEANDDGGGAI